MSTMEPQAKSASGRLRWYVYTNDGRKVVWEPSADLARERAERHDLTVERVEPAPSAR